MDDEAADRIRRHSPGRSLKQRRSQCSFEILEDLGRRRLSDADLLCGAMQVRCAPKRNGKTKVFESEARQQPGGEWLRHVDHFSELAEPNISLSLYHALA